MDADERAGQLLMVGLDDDASRTSLDRLVARRHLGGVILLGGWGEGAAAVRATTSHLEALASPEATAGLGLLIAADQEGGAVQQLKGDGFSTIPSARVQGRGSTAELEADATRWGRELAKAGINVNLAPVADTVPASLGTGNGPIGQYGRQYSSDPQRVAEMVPAFIAGMRAGGIASTVKHFPGIGRIVGNTDVTARGITDRRTTVDDPYLEPFAAGIDGGVDLVMVGSAIYTKLDPGTNASFSKPIVTDLLRGRLGWAGVVITDDVGAAKAVVGGAGGRAGHALRRCRWRHRPQRAAVDDPDDARRPHDPDGRRPRVRRQGRGGRHPGGRAQDPQEARHLPLTVTPADRTATSARGHAQARADLTVVCPRANPPLDVGARSTARRAATELASLERPACATAARPDGTLWRRAVACRWGAASAADGIRQRRDRRRERRDRRQRRRRTERWSGRSPAGGERHRRRRRHTAAA